MTRKKETEKRLKKIELSLASYNYKVKIIKFSNIYKIPIIKILNFINKHNLYKIKLFAKNFKFKEFVCPICGAHFCPIPGMGYSFCTIACYKRYVLLRVSALEAPHFILIT